MRCPECGSTNAGSDESRSMVDITCMQCNECGNYDFVDSWQRDFDWYLETEMLGDTIPDHLPPLPPKEALYAR